MRVLFKEDDDLAARTLERQLRKLGHASERIVDVGAFLAGESDLDPDVIITDIFMPDIEGLTFIRLLKRSRLSNVPILAISGGGSYMGGIPDIEASFVARAAVDFGAVKFLRKPTSLEVLGKAITDCVQDAATG